MKSTVPLAGAGVAPASAGEHVGTVLFGLWMTVGLFLDGYFHQNLERDGESFLTPWHAVFYSGFAASALWLAGMSRRRADGVLDWRLRSLPPGFGGARTGLALFAVGALGDATWHSAFGVERGIDALLSPTHLLLFVGLILVLTAPLRAAGASPSARPGRWMVSWSVISATALVGFFLNFAWGLGIGELTRVAYDPLSDVGETAVIAGVASTLVTTAVLFLAARVLLAAGAPPGALAVLFAVAATLVSGAFDEDAEGVAAAVVAGLVLEVVVRAWSRRRSRLPMQTCFAIAAASMWVTYFALLALLDGIAWPVEIWLGASFLNALAALLMAPVQIAEPNSPMPASDTCG